MSENTQAPNPPLWLVMLATAMAGGMGWGIRGQYGHETGAVSYTHLTLPTKA